MPEFPYNITNRTCTVIVEGRAYQTDRSNTNWPQIKEALNDPNTDAQTIVALMSPIGAIDKATRGNPQISVHDSAVWFGDEEIHSSLAIRILDIVNEGLELDPWIRFATNLYANPNQRSRDELYEFLEKSELPLTQDGCFIAYKKVDTDYRDLHTHTFDNSVGRVVTMPREHVDPDRWNTCSTGLHFCSKTYLPSFGNMTPTGHVMLVKINPADVVAIPGDYDNAKGRTWRYEVVGEIPEDEVPDYTWPATASRFEAYQWGWEEIPEVEDDGDDDGDDDDAEEGVVATADPTTLPPSQELQDAAADDDEFQRLLAEEAAIEAEPVIETVAVGLINRARLEELLAEYGTLKAIAQHFGLSAGTVQSWKRKLLIPVQRRGTREA